MRVYLDNCSFNRPYVEQTMLKIRLETQAKLDIQKQISDGKIELVWSLDKGILDKKIKEINVINPVDFAFLAEGKI